MVRQPANGLARDVEKALRDGSQGSVTLTGKTLQNAHARRGDLLPTELFGTLPPDLAAFNQDTLDT